MRAIRGTRLAALTGVAFTALVVLGTLVGGEDPGFVGEPGEIAAYFTKETDAVIASGTLYVIGAVFLLWFAGCLRAVLQRAEGGEGRLATTAFGGAVAGSAALIAAASVSVVGALRAQEQGTIDPQVATTLWDLSSILYGAAAPMGMAVLVLATAALALRTKALPVWLGAISVVLGIALALPPINYIAIIVFNFWVLATSIVLALQPEQDRAKVGVATPATAGV